MTSVMQTMWENLKNWSSIKKKMVPVNYSLIEFGNVASEWEEILNNIIFLTESGVIVLDDNDHIKGMNGYIADLFQVGKSQYYGRDIKELFDLKDLYDFVIRLGENKEADFYLKSIETRAIIKKKELFSFTVTNFSL